MIKKMISSYVRKFFEIGLSEKLILSSNDLNNIEKRFDKQLLLTTLILKRIKMIEQELAEQLNELTMQVEKVFDEVRFNTSEMKNTIQTLETQLQAAMQEVNKEISPETIAVLESLKARVQKIDDLTPDVVLLPSDETTVIDPVN